MNDTNTLEQAVLGCMLMNGGAAKTIERILTAEQFYGKNKKIFAIAKEILQAEKPLDALILIQAAKDRNALADIGGEAYVCGLGDKVSAMGHWKHYAYLLKTEYLKQKQRALAEQFRKDGEDADDFIAEVSAMQKEIVRLENDHNFSLKDVGAEVIDSLDKPLDVINTGYNSIDKTSAPMRGDLFVIGARPQAGKSLLVINMAKWQLQKSLKILIFTTEMQPAQYFRRQIALYTDVPFWALKFRRYADGQPRAIVDFVKNFTENFNEQLFYSNIARPSSDDIRAEVERVKPDVVIIDNLSGVRITDKYKNKTDNIAEFIDDVKDCGVTFGCAMFLVVHLNRASEGTKANDEPSMKDIKDSSHIEEAATQILLLWNKKKDDESADALKRINWKLAKDRDGFGGEGVFLLNRKNLVITEE